MRSLADEASNHLDSLSQHTISQASLSQHTLSKSSRKEGTRRTNRDKDKSGKHEQVLNFSSSCFVEQALLQTQDRIGAEKLFFVSVHSEAETLDGTLTSSGASGAGSGDEADRKQSASGNYENSRFGFNSHLRGGTCTARCEGHGGAK